MQSKVGSAWRHGSSECIPIHAFEMRSVGQSGAFGFEILRNGHLAKRRTTRFKAEQKHSKERDEAGKSARQFSVQEQDAVGVGGHGIVKAFS